MERRHAGLEQQADQQHRHTQQHNS